MRTIYRLTSIKFPNRPTRDVDENTFEVLSRTNRLRSFRWEKLQIKEAPLPEELRKRIKAIEVEEVNEEATPKRKHKSQGDE